MTVTDRREHAGGAAPTALASTLAFAGTTISVNNGTGWPTGAVGDFVVTLARGTTNEERVLCESRTGNVLTVKTSGRGWDGTTAREHASGTVVEHTWSTTEADEASAHGAAVAAHGVNVVVGTTETQSLSNKTLVSPTISGATMDSPNITGTIAGAPTISGNPAFPGSPNFSGTPTLGNYTNANHTHAAGSGGGNIPQSSVTGLTAAIAAKLDASQKAAANGVASLDASTLLPTAQLPTIPIAKVPTGTSGSTVALGNHDHIAGTIAYDGTGTTQNLSDGDPGPKTLVSCAVDAAGTWLIIASGRGFTLGSGGTNIRVSFALSTSSGTLTSNPVNQGSSGTGLEGGYTVLGLLVATGAATVSLTAEKVNTGVLATTSLPVTIMAIPLYV